MIDKAIKKINVYAPFLVVAEYTRFLRKINRVSFDVKSKRKIVNYKGKNTWMLYGSSFSNLENK